ncbi:NUDIX hydrolase [Viridibacillus sp. NPDC093762]|uniref:NUDIX hydrolase n=1 Tax=Viridibacillus sp. NPDC093762 TaxID=3390720 RepID=UPI003D03F1E3
MSIYKWQGAAGVSLNDNGEVLMVLQAAPGEDQKWTVPSGGVEGNETFEECCRREFFEETGYEVKVIRELYTKSNELKALGIEIDVHYFHVEIIGGEQVIADPDNLIYEIAWKKGEELSSLPMAYSDDVPLLQEFIRALK